MAITRIKNNQITDLVITNVKIASGTLTGDKMNNNLTFNSNLVLNGNLTVTGNVTAVQSTTTQITDPLLTLGLGNAGTSYDLGLVLIRGSGGNRFIGWKENQSAFVFINTTEDGLTTGNIATTAYGNLVFGNATALGATTLGGITIDGNTLSSAGAMTIRSDAGTITVANALVGTGAVSLGSTLSVFSTATVNALVSNGAIQGTTLSGSGNATVNALTVNNSATIGGTLGVVGNTTLGNASVTGTISVGSITVAAGIQNTPIGNAVASTGQFTTLGANGNVTAAALTVNNSATIGGTLGVVGNINGTSATLSGSATIGTTLGVVGAALIGTTLGVNGATTVSSLTVNNAITAATGTILGNLLVEGNLRVMGNLSYINVDEFVVEDPIIQLNTGPNGSPLSSDNGFDVGVRAHYYDTADRSSFFGRTDSTGFFEYFSNVTGESGNVITGTLGTIRTGNLQLTGAATVGSTLSVVSNATVAALTVNGAATVGGTLGVVSNINGTSATLTGSATIGTTLGVVGNINGTGITLTGSAGVSGNINTGGTLTSTATGSAVSGQGQIYLNGATINRIDLAAAGTGAPAFTTRSAGTKVVLYPSLTGATTDYAMGIDAATMWHSIPENGDSFKFKWYGATTEVANLTGTGILTVSGNIVAASGTASTNTTTGALVVAGGAGISGTLNVRTAANLGNVTFSNTTISSNLTNTGLTINPNGTGTTIFNSGLNASKTVIQGTSANTFVVTGTQIGINTATPTTGATMHFATNDSIILPTGAIGDRPGTPAVGMFRFSTTSNVIEWYDGTAWTPASTNFTIVTANTQTGNGSATSFTIPVANATTAGTIVSINGVVQEPITAYSISGNVVTFTEAPAITDSIDFRVFVTTTQVTAVTDVAGTTGLFFDEPTVGSQIIKFETAAVESFSIQANATSRFTGNVEPSANITYSLGSNTNRWKDLWLSGTTLYLGNIIVKETAGNTIAFYGPDGSTPATLSANGSSLIGVDATSITAGTSNVKVFSSSNIAVTVGGTANTVVFSSTAMTHSGSILPSANGTANIGSTVLQYNTIHAKATSAQYADLAENYAADAEYEAGTVLEFGGVAEVTLSETVMSTRVAGVVSTNPAYLMNNSLTGIKAPIALQGRVPCKVVGPVRKGDMMVSAGNGAAQAATAPVIGSVIGKSLENFDGAEGVIEVVVGRV